MDKLEKVYNPNNVEKNIYDFWMANNLFKATTDQHSKFYSIVIPPPNITGKLHMGHALDETLQDILIRFKRMQGYNVLWLPGTDHASIATEAKIVEQMRNEGVKKENIGREEFLKRAWDWKNKFGNEIVEQLKKIGSSCDWSRERFTLDKGCSEAVNEVFIRLYNKGLIYRGKRIINWCPNCKTSISDAEVEFKELEGSFWHIRYPIVDSDSYLELATTRPETMLGDTAVAVHPDDERYKHLIGKYVILPLVEKKIPIISDEYVEMDFGTGVVKITPAHDPNDFEVGLRHNLEVITVIDDIGNMNENAGKYKGLDRVTARKAIVSDLKSGGYLVKTEPIKHNVGTCYRCASVIEPKVSKQWFVKMQPLATPAIKAVQEKQVEFIPKRFEKIYYNWMNNIKDWCISRQLWWGHRIPAYYCQECGHTIVSKQKPNECPKCKSKNIVQDPDTLDTWFSSALWPFSSMGWPVETQELKYFYPTSTLVTGYDIIFFWVARMIFSAIEHTGKVPFKTVFIHGLVRDSQGRKMSKSLGNGIDPLEIINQYGADALRFALVSGNSPGSDMRFSDEKVKSARNFANKIWNSARYIHMNIDDCDIQDTLPEKLNLEDKWMLHTLNLVVKDVNDNLQKFELGIAIQKIYDLIWNDFCDWYIELSKIRISQNQTTAIQTKQVLVWTFNNILKLLHPFMPFITEQIWQSFNFNQQPLMIASYPQYSQKLNYSREYEDLQKVMEVIKKIRNKRSQMNVPPSRKTRIYINSSNKDIYQQHQDFIKKLAYGSSLYTSLSDTEISDSVVVVTSDAKVYIPMDQLIDKKNELVKLQKDLELSLKKLNQYENKLNNNGFMTKAPKQVVQKIIKEHQELQNKINLIKNTIHSLAE